MAAGSTFDSFFILTKATITDRDSVQPRRWGMLVTVTDDPTSTNNITWELKKGLADDDINNNANWQTAAIGGGVPGGSSGGIQYNSAGNFAGFGNWDGALLTTPSSPTPGAAGRELRNVATNDRFQEFLSLAASAYGGGSVSTNIFDGANVPNDTVFQIECYVNMKQTSGTSGSSAIGMKVRAMFRKTSAGTFAQVGASAQDFVYNDTGDAFVGTPGLSISGGSIVFSMNLTTTKTFNVRVWTKVIMDD